MPQDLYKKEEKLGEYGKASVTVNSELKVKVQAEAEVDLLAEIDKMVKATDATWDDQAAAWLKGLVASYNALNG